MKNFENTIFEVNHGFVGFRKISIKLSFSDNSGIYVTTNSPPPSMRRLE